MNRTAIALVLVWATAAAWPRAAAGDARTKQRADRHLAKGLELYQAREYDRAIREFQRGYAVEPRREFLYALGQAERLSGDCPSAIIYYRKFLSRNPPEKAAKAAFDQLEACEKALSSHPEPAGVPRRAAEPKPAPVTAPPPAPVAPTRAAARPWYRDTLGTALMGTGAALLVVSGGFYASARSTSDRAHAAEDYPTFDRLADQARSRRNLAIGMAAGGAVLAGAAVYRLVWGRDRSERRIEAAPTAGGAMVSVGGRF